MADLRHVNCLISIACADNHHLQVSEFKVLVGSTGPRGVGDL